MDSVKKHWKDFSGEEQLAKLKQIGEALKKCDLQKEVKIKESQQVVFKLQEAGACQVNHELSLQGEVSASKAENVEVLNKDLNTGAFKDVSPASYQFDIDIKPATGGPFIPITEIIDIYSQEDRKIEHKAGQVLLIDFWATWCPPCQEPMAHN